MIMSEDKKNMFDIIKGNYRYTTFFCGIDETFEIEIVRKFKNLT